MVPRKLVERFIGLLPLLLVPVLVIPALVVVVLTMTPDTHRSWSSVWVSNSEIGRTPLGSENTQASPAGRQAQVLSELMMTQQFSEQVAVNAGLLPPRGETVSVQEERARLRLTGEVQKAVGIAATGVNLLSISAEGDTPEQAQALNAAVISTYEERIATENARQSEIAVDYFTEQLTVAQEELESRRSELQAYLALHPTAADPAVLDVEYDALAERLTAQRLVVGNLQNSLQQAQLSALTAEQSQSAFFRVEDAPNRPVFSATLGIVKTVGYPLAGMAFGAMISLVYLYLVYRADHTVRSGEDVAPIGLPVLGVIPEMKSKHYAPWYRRIGRGQRHFARRVAMHTAGATRPPAQQHEGAAS